MTIADIAQRPVPLATLQDHARGVLEASGVVRDHADLVSASLVDAEARGIGSHGLTRLRIYSERVRKGAVDGAATPAISRRAGGVVQIDAHNALGQVGASAAADAAVDLAREQGIALAGVRDSNHCGTLAFFTRRIATAGLIAIGMSTAPPTMVYFGGRTPAVGTNPLSLAVPRADGPPLVVDMATSATARGKIIVAEQLGKSIPPDWALNDAGRPTTDAAEALAGSMLPFGGPKGSGLAMMIDLIAGGLIGAAMGFEIGNMYEEWDRPQRVGHAFIVIEPSVWSAGDDFAARVARFTDELSLLPPADGHRGVLSPGTLEEEALARAAAEGLQVPLPVLRDLIDLAGEVGSRDLISDEVATS